MSLSNRLSLYVSIAIIAMFAAIVTVFFRYGVELEERLAASFAREMVNGRISRLSDELGRVEYHLRNSAPMVADRLGRHKELAGAVERIVTTDSLLMGGSVALVPDAAGSRLMEYVSIKPDGTIEHKQLGNTDYDYTTMSWFTDAVASDSTMWSDPYYDRGAGDELMVTCSLPLHDGDGRTLAVLTADVALSMMRSEVSRLSPFDGAYSFIISKKGRFLSHPDSTLLLYDGIFSYARAAHCKHLADIGWRMMHGQSGTVRTDICGTDAIVVFDKIPGTDWSICCVCPYASIMSQLDSVSVKAVVFLIVGLLIIIILVRCVVLYSMKPLTRLTSAATEIAEGDLNVSLPDLPGRDDIARLNNAFAEMQTSLRQQMAQLVITTRAKERIESELNIARSIQMSLVPHDFSPFPDYPGLELYASIRPAREVGGDLYDYFIRDSRLYFIIGDVSGKGVPAALFMAVTRTLFRSSAERTDSPAAIVTAINDTIIEGNDACMFVTLFVGVLDLATGKLTYCNAGHNQPVLISDAKAALLTVRQNIPAGVFGGYDYEQECLSLSSGDALFLYTDGLTEAENSDHELFGDDRMLSLLSSQNSPREIIGAVDAAVSRYAGSAEQSDDLTMLCIRFHN